MTNSTRHVWKESVKLGLENSFLFSISTDMPINYSHWFALKETIIEIKTEKGKQVLNRKVKVSSSQLKISFANWRRIWVDFCSMKHCSLLLLSNMVKKEAPTEKGVIVDIHFPDNFSTNYYEEINTIFSFGFIFHLDSFFITRTLVHSSISRSNNVFKGILKIELHSVIRSEGTVYAIWSVLKPYRTSGTSDKSVPSTYKLELPRSREWLGSARWLGAVQIK